MQRILVVTCSFSLLLSTLASPTAAQMSSRLPRSGIPPSTLAIEKTNRRPQTRAAERDIAEYEKLVSANPTNAILLNNLGAAYFSANRIFEAQSWVRKAAARAPDNVPIKVNLAVILNEVYNPPKAIEMLEGVLRSQPDHTRARSTLCEIYAHQGLLKEGIACYEVLQKAGDLAEIPAANFGTLLLDNDEIDRALRLLQWAEAKFPNNASIKNGLGIALFRKEKFSRAEQSLRRAVELAPDSTQARFNLAVAQMATNKKAEVLEQYKYLKTSDPDLADKLYKIIFRDKLVFVDQRR